MVAESVATQKPRIVSLGGGTIMQPQNLALLREAGAVLIWLHCPIEELLHRCAHITDRPLFRDEASFRRLYEERLPTYELADYRVESQRRTVAGGRANSGARNFSEGDRMTRAKNGIPGRVLGFCRGRRFSSQLRRRSQPGRGSRSRSRFSRRKKEIFGFS